MKSLQRKKVIKIPETPQKRKPEVNVACTGTRKLVLGWEGIIYTT